MTSYASYILRRWRCPAALVVEYDDGEVGTIALGWADATGASPVAARRPLTVTGVLLWVAGADAPVRADVQPRYLRPGETYTLTAALL